MMQDLVQHAWREAQAAPDLVQAKRWLDRAHRLAPNDRLVTFALATNLLGQSLFAEAEPLFLTLAEAYNAAAAWAGVATCAHLRGASEPARMAVRAILRSATPTPAICSLADTIAGAAGWCGLTTDGELMTGCIGPVRVSLDGQPSGHRLPATWREADTLQVWGPHGPMLGSPLPVRRFAGLEGVVEAVAGGVQGWAWFPADPLRDPTLHVTGSRAARLLSATKPATPHADASPLARLRTFALTEAEVAVLGEPLAFKGPDGRHVLGSPLDPGAVSRIAPTPVCKPSPRPTTCHGPRPVDVIIPFYRGLEETKACIDSVLATLPSASRLIVVDDASPETKLAAQLRKLARQRRLRLIRLPSNRGFPAAANVGLRAATGRDVVLLNSDTLVPPLWLDRLHAAAYREPGIGTVTPLTNDGTIVSYPDPHGFNPVPDLAATIATDALAQKANGPALVDIPVGVGFCLYLRRDCLDQVGLFREDLFAQGYGEENDLCLRAGHLGWRNVAAPGIFVAHLGATSFGPARAHLIRRNTKLLERLHPGYDALVASHLANDPLLPARRGMDALRWPAGRKTAGSTIYVTHAGGGGVDRVVAGRALTAERSGRRPIVLRPARTASGPAVRVEQPNGSSYPNLVYPMPAGLPALAKLLRPDRPGTVEQHHSLGHHPGMAELAYHLGISHVAIVHDYARFCPRITLVNAIRHYCGEPDLAGCITCVAELGSLLGDQPPLPALLERSGRELSEASTIIVPSADTAARLARHFRGISTTIQPWEDDHSLPPLAPSPQHGTLRVAVIGAIGVEKGYDIVRDCAQDAHARSLPLEFVVVGFTADDERLLAAGPVFITGEYQDENAIDLIRAQRAQCALIPSVWPETWCFALSRAWQAGLPAIVFDLGAQAARVRATGRGWVLPLGLPPSALNDTVLRLAQATSKLQYPYRAK